MSIETIQTQDNFTAINLGSLSNLDKYELKGPDGKVRAHGKVFLRDPLHATGAEVSFTSVPPGQSGPFFHLHKENEELYMIIRGTGEFQVDDQVFPIKEGSVVRVGVNATHNLKNTGSEPLIFICYQSKANTFPGHVEGEAEITQTPPKFTK